MKTIKTLFLCSAILALSVLPLQAQVFYAVPVQPVQPIVVQPVQTVPVYPVYRWRAPLRNALWGPLYYVTPVQQQQQPNIINNYNPPNNNTSSQPN